MCPSTFCCSLQFPLPAHSGSDVNLSCACVELMEGRITFRALLTIVEPKGTGVLGWLQQTPPTTAEVVAILAVARANQSSDGDQVDQLPVDQPQSKRYVVQPPRFG